MNRKKTLIMLGVLAANRLEKEAFLRVGEFPERDESLFKVSPDSEEEYPSEYEALNKQVDPSSPFFVGPREPSLYDKALDSNLAVGAGGGVLGSMLGASVGAVSHGGEGALWGGVGGGLIGVPVALALKHMVTRMTDNIDKKPVLKGQVV